MNLTPFGLEHDYQVQTSFLHPQAHKAFLSLQKSGKNFDLDLQVASGFRSFERQKVIWNAKAKGQRTLLDSHSKPVSFEDLSPLDLLHTILRWSALPGFSRHHWGSDFDIIDQQALKENPDYQVQLIPSEYGEGGIFQELGKFLNEELEPTDFYRPYEKDLGGVAPEPWHLSYKPLAEEFTRLLSYSYCLEFLNSEHFNDILLREEIIENFEEIFGRYITNNL